MLITSIKATRTRRSSKDNDPPPPPHPRPRCRIHLAVREGIGITAVRPTPSANALQCWRKSLPRYSQDSRCPKCGDVAFTRYSAEMNAMRRECRRCLYDWHELPLDEKEAPK